MPEAQPEPGGESRSRIWVVLPTYNEKDNIERIVQAVRMALPESRTILIVDDDSPDGTGEIAARLASEHPDVEHLHREVKEGLGPAYIAGFRRALAGGAELIIEMDSDFSHDPSALPALVAASENADVVLGSRYVNGGGVADWGVWRRLISKGGGTYARLMLGVGVRDLTGGFKCFRREVLASIEIESVSARGYAFQVELTYRALKAGFRVVEIPIVFRDREHGDSKMSGSIVSEAIWKVPAMRFGANRWRP